MELGPELSFYDTPFARRFVIIDVSISPVGIPTIQVLTGADAIPVIQDESGQSYVLGPDGQPHRFDANQLTGMIRGTHPINNPELSRRFQELHESESAHPASLHPGFHRCIDQDPSSESDFDGSKDHGDKKS